ncbi:14999_t:CDS:2 [Entrophospora sp. SA101]|nr:14999_t:CDS:2 [Entrophospora sp. SA101]
MTGGSLRHRNLGVGDIGNAVDTVVDDHNYRNSRSRQKRQSLASRLIRLFIWTVLASLIFLLFNVPDQDSDDFFNDLWEKILSLKKWKRQVLDLLKFSSVCLSLTFINYIFLEYIQPFMKNTQKPNYKYWQQDKNLKKYIILATITGTVGLTGMSVSLWDVWGFFGAPLVISSFLMLELIKTGENCCTAIIVSDVVVESESNHIEGPGSERAE